MKVLITGSTSSQSSKKTYERVPTFAGLISKNLLSSGVEVEFSRPYLEWDKKYLKEFDAVLVGIAPLTSLSSNSLYPALAVASRAEKIGNLSFFIDAPEPQKIAASLASFKKGKVDLFKPFYETRREYEKLSGDSKVIKEIEDFCGRLTSSEWPTTLYPWTPLIPPMQVKKHLPWIPEESIYSISIDSYLMEDYEVSERSLENDPSYWVYDSNKTKWFESTQRSLRHEAIPMKKNRFSGCEETSRRISNAVGSLVTTYRSEELWWSPLLSNSLNLGVPAASDWRITRELGDDWNYLPARIEDMTNLERFELASGQRSSYMKALDSKSEATEVIISALTK